MTDTQLSAAEVLRGQLLDVLVDVPAIALGRLDRATTLAVFDWCETAQDLAARMRRIPEPPKAIRGYLRPPQI